MLNNNRVLKMALCLVLCLSLAAVLPLQSLAAENTYTVTFDEDAVGSANGNFNVVEADGRRYVSSAATGFGTTVNLYAGQLGDAVKEGFEISVEFMFPTGTEGILWLYMKGMSTANDFQMMDVSYIGGVTRVYAQDGPSLGNIDDTSALGVQVKPDTWHTMKVIKDNALYSLFLDDVKVLEYNYPDTNNAPTEIWLMQFLTAGAGASYDTLTLKTLPPKQVAAESISVNSSAASVVCGGSVNLNAVVEPANANNYDAVEWFVKAPGAEDYVKQDATVASMTLSCTEIGEYSVYAKVADKQSEPVTISATKPADELVIDFEADPVGTVNNMFTVHEGDGNHYLASAVTGFAASNNLYAGQLGSTISENFTVSADFRFPAGSEGIVWIYMKGMSAANDFQMMDVSYVGGVTRVYAQDGPSLGNIDDTSTLGVQVKAGTWHTMKVEKVGSQYTLYLDGVKVLEYVYADTNNAPTEIWLMQYLTAGESVHFDNLVLHNDQVTDQVPETGDTMILAVAAAAIVSAGGVLLLSKKRRGI